MRAVHLEEEGPRGSEKWALYNIKQFIIEAGVRPKAARESLLV